MYKGPVARGSMEEIRSSMGWTGVRVKGPEAGSKASNNEDLEKVKGKSKFRDIPSPPFPAPAGLVETGQTGCKMDQQTESRFATFFPHNYIISCSDKMDKV